MRIFGSRYGSRVPPKEDFHVWLCDHEFKAITDFPVAYSKVKRGTPGWITLKVKPTNAPAKFIICVGFNPSAKKGVSVSYDTEGSGHPLSGGCREASRERLTEGTG